jgi:hypothetical protein
MGFGWRRRTHPGGVIRRVRPRGKDLFDLLAAVPDPALFDVRGRAPNEGEAALRCQYAGASGSCQIPADRKKEDLWE